MSSRIAAVVTLFAFMFLLGGCGSTPPRPDAQQMPKSGTGADALLATGLARYAGTRDASQALDPLRRAAEQAPQRPELQWLYAFFCAQSAGCDAASAETRLRKLAPGNGTAWLGALARAQQQRDAAAQAQILDALSRSEHINLYWNTLIWRTALALRDSNPNQPAGIDDALTRSMNLATEQLSAIAILTLRPIVAACDTVQVQRATTAAHCSLIAQVLQRSDTYIAAGVGLGVEERMSPPGSASAQAVSERIRLARYRQETASEIMESVDDRAALSQELIALMQKLSREQEVFSAVLRWAGLPTTPPPEWKAASVP